MSAKETQSIKIAGQDAQTCVDVKVCDQRYEALERIVTVTQTDVRRLTEAMLGGTLEHPEGFIHVQMKHERILAGDDGKGGLNADMKALKQDRAIAVASVKTAGFIGKLIWATIAALMGAFGSELWRSRK